MPEPTTSPASMGGPLSETERAGANSKYRPVADGGPIREDRLAEIREEAGYANVTVDADELLWLLNERDRLEAANEELSIKWAGLSEERIRRENAEKAMGVLEGQLATAQAELEEQRYYGEQLQMSIEGCSGNHDDALGLDGGGSDE